MTQDDNLLPWRTTIDNVLFPLEVQGALDDAARARAQELIGAVGLTGFERYYPHELSGGMRKRAALIRTLVYDPPMILMDEPFAAVDAQTRTQLQQELLRLWSLKRKTIVFVTHDITEAIALGDRALVLTQRPARVAAEHPIPIPRPRNVKDIFTPPGFAAIYERIRAMCNEQRRITSGLPESRTIPRQWIVTGGRVLLARRWSAPGSGGARLRPLFFAPPLATAERIVEMIGNGKLLTDTIATLRVSALGFVIGCAAGIGLPFLLRLSRA